ncbi:hypothetical protein [Halobacteriovorax sp.]|uniref:hypothetical protein n=1 Tax=Halobacteriovorax sp. TaxID=2020862 RepID=UPI003569F40B
MRYIKQYIFTILALIQMTHGRSIVPLNNTIDAPSIEKAVGESVWKKILSGDIYTKSEVKDFKLLKQKKQKLDFFIAGLHKKSCSFALRKLSHYESYKDHIGFIKRSSYDDKNGRVDFLLSSALLPYNMTLNFKIPRLKKVGSYPFIFDKGFLKNLTGTITAINYKNRCLFYTTAHWEGADTGIPNSILGFFSKAMSQLAMENLFRISSTY